MLAHPTHLLKAKIRAVLCLHMLITFIAVYMRLGMQVYAQAPLIVQHYTNENGLPANGISGIQLDKSNGFLWVGTQAGLVRFDGKNFTSWQKEGAGAGRIIALSKNRQGTIFSEDDKFSVLKVAGNKPEYLMKDTLLPPATILKGGSFNDKTVNQVAADLRKLRPSSFLPDWVTFHDERNDGSSFTFLYFGHACHYDAGKDTLLYFSQDLGFRRILKLSGHVYFVRENLDLWEYNDSLMQLSPVRVENMPSWSEEGEKPRYIWQQGMREPLVVYKQNVWRMKRTGRTLLLQPLCRRCCPTDAHINAAQIWEEQGVMIFSSIVNGVYVVRKPFLHSISTDSINVYKTGKAEYAQAEIIPGAITVSSGHSFSPQGKLLPGRTVTEFHAYTIYKDRLGDFWFHIKDTIIRFRPKTGQYAKIDVKDKAIRMLFAESNNRTYVVSDKAIGEITSSQDGLSYKLMYSTTTQKNSLSPDAVIEWKPGVLAIAAEKLVLFDTRKGTALDTIPIPGLKSKVRTLSKYGDYVLIGTYGQGFYMYKDGVIKKMPLDKYRYLSYAHCFVLDNKGFCWISTNHGLFKVSFSALEAAFKQNLEGIYYHYFGKNDGILNTEFNGGCQPCALRLRNGLFSFPSMSGMSVLDPGKQHTPPPSGRIFVEEILTDSVSHQLGDDSLNELPYSLSNMQFKIALSQFGNAENIYFSYKLSPYSDKWVTHDIAENKTLQFGGLKPGSYKLYLRIANGFGANQFRTTVVSFRILRPWYQTWWFYLVCGIGFLTFTWGLVKWRTARILERKAELQQLVDFQTKNISDQSQQLAIQLTQLETQQIRLREDNQIKARLIAIMSHDMISPLKFISYMSKKLRPAFEETDPNHQTATLIYNIAQDLESLSVNILNWIRFHHDSFEMVPEAFDTGQLTMQSVEIARTLAIEKGLKFDIHITESMEVVQYPQAIGVILYNLAMNAIKYTQAGGIKIIGQLQRDKYILSVSDTGCGMPEPLVEQLNSPNTFVSGFASGEAKKYKFGYALIKDLLKLSLGNMRVSSKLGEGTTVTIEFQIMRV